MLKVPQADGSGYLLDNLKLPAAAADSTPITWASTNPAAISTSGVVTRQAEDAEVTLTASAAGKTDLQFHFKVPGTLTSVNDLPGVQQMQMCIRDRYWMKQLSGPNRKSSPLSVNRHFPSTR